MERSETPPTNSRCFSVKSEATLAKGNAENEMRLAGFSTKEGVEVNLSRGVTLIIGPNNVGKSLLLGELFQAIHNVENGDYDSHQIVRRRSLVFDDTLVERVMWINDYLPGLINPSAMFLDPSEWKDSNFQGVIQVAIQKLVLYLSYHGRSLVVNECSMYDTATQQPESPLQHLYESKDIELAVSKATQEAFNIAIVVNRLRGSMISLHLESYSFTGDPNSDDDNRRYFNSLVKIDHQGDGLRAYVGTLMSILTSKSKIILIDEPEAFLHPPQARRLGEFLAKLRQNDVQVIIATHSTDIIQGVMSGSSESADHSIIRVTRNSNQKRFHSVPESSLKELFADRLLRHSNILDGLFYHGVVVCESEADSSYYGAVYQSADAGSNPDRRGLDLLFAQCHSKDRVHHAVRLLRSAGTPTASILDIDVPRDRTMFARTLEAHGGDGEECRDDLEVIYREIGKRNHFLDRLHTKQSLIAAIDTSISQTLDEQERKELLSLLARKDGWDALKQAGVNALSGTEAYNAILSLIAYSQSFGMFILEVGELESFHPQVSRSNKSKWISDVLEREEYAKPGAQMELIAAIATYFRSAQ